MPLYALSAKYQLVGVGNFENMASMKQYATVYRLAGDAIGPGCMLKWPFQKDDKNHINRGNFYGSTAEVLVGIPTNVRAMQARERERNMQSGPEPVLQDGAQLRLHPVLSALKKELLFEVVT
jgi:hypothetical protein